MPQYHDFAQLSLTEQKLDPIMRALVEVYFVMALPHLIDPRKMALQSATLEGELNSEQLPRLLEAVLAVKKPFQAFVAFTIDEGGQKEVGGNLQGQVSVNCQRCLNPVDVTLGFDFNVSIVWDEEHAEKLPSHREPWIVEEQTADVVQLLEDEILLALPIVNYHEAGQCTGDIFIRDEEPDEVVEDNPFNVLAQLKK